MEDEEYISNYEIFKDMSSYYSVKLRDMINESRKRFYFFLFTLITSFIGMILVSTGFVITGWILSIAWVPLGLVLLIPQYITAYKDAKRRVVLKRQRNNIIETV